MTYTKIMYDMPPNKVGERNEYWQLKIKPPGALAASCVVNKYWEDIHAVHEEHFNEAVLIYEQIMKKYPVKKTAPWLRKLFDVFHLSFLYETEDMTAKDRAHIAYPAFEEISDEEWMRRAAPIHYPYHTPASKKAYDEEMVIRRRNRAIRWEMKFAEYARNHGTATETSSLRSVASAAFDSKNATLEEFLEYIQRQMVKWDQAGISKSHPLYVLALHKAEKAAEFIAMEFDSDFSSFDSSSNEWDSESETDVDSDSASEAHSKAGTKIEYKSESTAEVKPGTDASDSSDSSGSETKVGSESSSRSVWNDIFSDIDFDSEFLLDLDFDSDSDSSSSLSITESDASFSSSEASGSCLFESDPRWHIELDETMLSTNVLDFDNDPFLCNADEEFLDDVKFCFYIRDNRIHDELLRRLHHERIQDDWKEFERLYSMWLSIKVRVDIPYEPSVHSNNPDDEAEENEDARDGDDQGDINSSDHNEPDEDDPEAQPEWLRHCATKFPSLIVEASEMDVSPRRIDLYEMSEEEEQGYLAERRKRDQIFCEFAETEQERRDRVAREVEEMGKGIQWLITKDLEDFPFSPRVSHSTHAPCTPVPTEESLVRPSERSFGQEFITCADESNVLKCSSAGPQHIREFASQESTPATSPKNKSLVARSMKKLKHLSRKLKRKNVSDDSSEPGGDAV